VERAGGTTVPEPGSAAVPVAAQPTSVALPGYRFLQCFSQTPLGDFWTAEGPGGRACRALFLSNLVGDGGPLMARLRALHHPALPPAEVFQGPEGRVVLITDHLGQALRERFDQCLAEGLPGIPRPELLGYLGAAARALDTLYREQGLLHLGLNPSNLLLDRGELRVADFGVVQLAWLPAGQSVGPLNGRYAAPELLEDQVSPTADQYSLALIYAEMLSGLPPRPPPRPPAAGGPRPGSGLYRRPGSRSGVRAPARFGLDLLPATDRPALARALDADPGKRFASCGALVEALEAAAAGGAAAQDLYRCLPPVIPFGSLLGEPAAPDTPLPRWASSSWTCWAAATTRSCPARPSG
jgi:serine/threonine protein kinase